MLKRKLFWWTDKSDSEWLSIRFRKWAAHCQGYSKLYSTRISRGCQTMMDRPERPEVVGNRLEVEVVSLPQSTLETSEHLVNVESNLSDTDEDLQCPAVSNTLIGNVFNNQEILDYLSYLNRPVININDNFIEIHQYHFSPEMLKTPQEQIRPPTRRKHRINMSSTEIVNTSALEPLHTEKYKEFLVRKSEDLNRSIVIVPERKEEKSPSLAVDEHRELKQALVEQRNACCKEEIRFKRGHAFTVSSNRKNESLFDGQNQGRNFLSFRASKKNSSGRRKKKVVVGEKGLDGPIWPGVLLTFDRAVSPVQTGCEEDETDI